MSNAFLDTTIFCDALGLSTPARKQVASSALAKYQKTEAPFYALKELRAGPLASWILAHNILVAHNTILEAVDRISRATAFKPRQGSVASKAIISGMVAVLAQIKISKNPKDYDEKTELENYLCRYIFKQWQKRRTIVNQIVQPLSCFIDSDLILDGKLIRFAGDSPECSKASSCGAAIELKKYPEEIDKILIALRPPKTIAGTEKRETTRRRAALKEVLNRASNEFPRKDCRALGDAYFCIMAPSNSEILTTNASDFEPMTQVLNKILTIPS
ncbi:MAG TPA: hypothetical protein VMV48_08525 [Gallionellaceae bacterium]|nr:hypothetical protein [Gallionellaceae bacterium]